MNFNADPNWREHYEEKKKYEVWEFFFYLKILAAQAAIGAIAWILLIFIL